MESPVAMTPQRSFRFPGGSYPAGRRQFFANHYLRTVQREAAVAGLPPQAVGFLLAVALEEDRNWYRRPASFFNDQLSRVLDCSEDTMDRTRKALIRAGLLHYERVGDRRAAIYWVKELPHWETWQRPAETPERLTGRTSAEATAEASAGADAEASADPPYPIEDLPPPPPNPDPWDAVVAGLRSLGAMSPAGSAEDARRNGFAPELALACVEFVLQPDNRAAYGAGAVVKRFRNPEANRWPASQNWPPVSSQAQLLRDREREAERAAQARQAEAAKAAEVSTLRKRQEQLLLQWGDEIDRLTPDQRVELVRDRGPAIVREVTRQPDWRANAFIRGPLLEAFAARYGSN